MRSALAVLALTLALPAFAQSVGDISDAAAPVGQLPTDPEGKSQALIGSDGTTGARVMIRTHTSEDLRAAARAFVATPGQQLVISDILSAEAVMAQIELKAPALSGPEWAAVAQIVSEELGSARALVERAMVRAALHLYTLEEMEALTAFLSTSEGIAISEKRAAFDATVYIDLAGAIDAAEAAILQRIEYIVD